MEQTVREVAILFNITKESIYRKINISMKNELSNYIIKKNNKTYISDVGQRIIYNSLNCKKNKFIKNINNNIDGVINHRNSIKTIEYIKFLENELKIEREYSKNMSEQLIDISKKNQELIQNTQILLNQILIKIESLQISNIYTTLKKDVSDKTFNYDELDYKNKVKELSNKKKFFDKFVKINK